MTKNTRILRSSIAIDLGAKYSGVIFTNQLDDNQPKVKACTFVMPSDEKGLKYSQKTRTAARHRIRGLKRFKLARRLLNEIISEQLKNSNVVLDKISKIKLQEALSGLLKRRGYSRIESETDITVVEKVNPYIFCRIGKLDQFFNDSRSIVNQWEDLSQDFSILEKFRSLDFPNNEDIEEALLEEGQGSKQEIKMYSEAIKTLFNDANNLIDQKQNGHKHRTEYLKCLKEEIKQDSRLRFVIDLFGGIDRFYNLVGNISNLQLRAVRWYFNRPELIANEKWDAKHLQSSIIRAFKYFHYKGEDKQKYRELIKELEDSENIIDSLCRIDPERTIPVYEDQNNRNPPYDRTLLLSPISLQVRYGDMWRSWATSLAGADPSLTENLDKIISYTDRRSRVKALGGNPGEPNDYKSTYILQRVLDRSKKFDPYQLRRLRQGEISQKLFPSLKKLEMVIGNQHVKEFLNFCDDYYNEVERAKSGLWSPSESNLLERADIHPPKKSKNLPLLLANIFGKDEDFSNKFLAHWTDKATVGRSSIFSICRNAEQLRKKYGNEFNLLYNQLDLPSFPFKGEEKKAFEKVRTSIEMACAHIQSYFDLTDEEIRRIKNPFSFAQIYTLTQDNSGFCSNSIAVQYENNWRSKVDDQGYAKCSRLAADSVAPFDGQLGRVLDRQAWEIAKVAAQEIKKHELSNTSLLFTVLIEQNAFEFTESLATLKNQRNKEKEALKQIERQNRQWMEKDDRIKEASQNICPYTGETIGDQGEIDHIIPRSYSLKNMGTIFNSEANLIYVSKKGNKLKNDRFVGLDELNKKYLLKQFGTDNTGEIEAKITSKVLELSKRRRLRYFDRLSDEEQKLVRHALFLDDDSEAKKCLLETLSSLWSSRVNGTQAWFVKLLMEKLKDHLNSSHNELTIDSQAFFLSAKEVSDQRRHFAKLIPAFQKTSPQPIASHAIDALSVFGTAMTVDKLGERICNKKPITDNSYAVQTKSKDIRLLDHVLQLWPNQCSVVQIKAKSFLDKNQPASNKIFKETIYSQNFLPIMIRGKELRVGFSPKDRESVKISGKNPEAFVEMVRPFVDSEINFPGKEGEISVYRLNKSSALRFLSENSTSVDEGELKLMKLLRSLSYCMLKIDISSVLRDSKKPGLLSSVEVITDKDFTLGFSFSNREKGSTFSFKGKIIHPVKRQWEEIEEKIRKKAGEQPTEKPGEMINAWLQSLISNGSKRPHSHVRKVFSLPMPASPSGGFQIQRTSINGQKIIQTHAIEGNSNAGFICEQNGIVNWSRPVVLNYLLKGDVSPLEETDSDKELFVRMDEFRKVIDENEIEIWMAPWSKPRRCLRVTLPFHIFKRLISSSCQINEPLDLQAAISVGSFDFKDAGLTEYSEIMGKPRGNLIMLEVGDKITFQYTPESSSKKMNEAFNSPVKK